MLKLAMTIKTDDAISGTRAMDPHGERNISSLWVHGLNQNKMTEKWKGPSPDVHHKEEESIL